MKVPFMFAEGVLTIIAGGEAHTVGSDHLHYKAIRDLLSKPDNEGEILELLNVVEHINSNVEGTLRVVGDCVEIDGEKVRHMVCDRIVSHMREGVASTGLENYLKRLLKNPSFASVNESFDFAENKNLPVTEDGYLLAYKAINYDWTDKYSGKIDNSVGAVVKMDRNKVDDNRRNDCSYGLHVGAMAYVSGYGCEGRDRFIIVKVDPADIISVPTDYHCQKMRVCKYEVVAEYTGELTKPSYRASTNDIQETAGMGGYAFSEGEKVYQDDDDFFDDDDVWDDGDVVSEHPLDAEVIEDEDWDGPDQDRLNW